MSGTISFQSIPANARVPLFHIEFNNTLAGVNQTTQRALLMGASTVAGLPATPVYLPSAQWAASTFGPTSMLARMATAYVLNDPYTELFALPVYDTGATNATASVVIGGTATAAGLVSLYVDGDLWDVPVTVGQTGTSVAAQYTGTGIIPANASVSVSGVTSGTISLATTIPGLIGNAHDVRLNYYGPANGEVLPAGLTLTINPFSGGAGVPTLTGLAAALGDANYDFIASPYVDSGSLAAMTTVLAPTGSGRWSDISQSYGHAWGFNSNTQSNLVTFGGTVNDQNSTVFGLYNSPTPPWIWTAAIAGAVAPALQADPARPVQTLPVLGVLAPWQTDRFTKSQRQTLLTNGVATVVFDQGGNCSIERAVTTYQYNKFGQPDQSYLDTETMYTLMYLARSLAGYVTQQFPRAKLADDGTRFGPGQPIVTPSIIKAALIAHYNFLETQGIVEDTAAFSAGLVVQRNASDASRVDVLYDPWLVSGLRIFAAQTAFRLAAA